MLVFKKMSSALRPQDKAEGLYILKTSHGYSFLNTRGADYFLRKLKRKQATSQHGVRNKTVSIDQRSAGVAFLTKDLDMIVCVIDPCRDILT